MSIHEAIDHEMASNRQPSINTSCVDGVIAKTNEYKRVSPDVEDHLAFLALFYYGKTDTVSAILKVWQTAAYRHWGIWLRHDPEMQQLKLYTYREGRDSVEDALWFIYEDYKPTREDSTRFNKALIANNTFVLFVCDGNRDVDTPMLGITLRRVNGDEFVATEVVEVPPGMAEMIREQNEPERKN